MYREKLKQHVGKKWKITKRNLFQTSQSTKLLWHTSINTRLTTESYTISLLESSCGNIPSCSWPNHCSDVVKLSSMGAINRRPKQIKTQMFLLSEQLHDMHDVFSPLYITSIAKVTLLCVAKVRTSISNSQSLNSFTHKLHEHIIEANSVLQKQKSHVLSTTLNISGVVWEVKQHVQHIQGLTGHQSPYNVHHSWVKLTILNQTYYIHSPWRSQSAIWELHGLCSVLRPLQHSIGYLMCMGVAWIVQCSASPPTRFYRSKNPTDKQ